MAELIRLVLVDHRLDGECVAAALKATQRFADPIRLVSAMPAALDEVRQTSPHVVIVGWDFSARDGVDQAPTGEGALDLTRRLSVSSPDVKVLILGLRESRDNVLECIKAGAASYVTNCVSVHELVERIAQVLRGETPPPPPHITSAVFCELSELARACPSNGTSDHVLTDREREVWRLLAEGLSNKQIANRLRRSVHTIKNHVHNILTKLGAEGRHEAALAYRAAADSMPGRGTAPPRHLSATQSEPRREPRPANGSPRVPTLDPDPTPSYTS